MKRDKRFRSPRGKTLCLVLQTISAVFLVCGGAGAAPISNLNLFPAGDAPEAVLKSPHAALTCTSCHLKSDVRQKKVDLGKASCTRCHEAENLTYRASGHGARRAGGDEDAPACWSCHGRHAIYSPAAQEALFRDRTVKTCLICHTDERVGSRHNLSPGSLVVAYEWSVHGSRALNEQAKPGERRPICIDCHGSHNLHPIENRRSVENGILIEDVCSNSQCHVEIGKAYALSVHRKAMVRGNPEAPTCIGCHEEHNILAGADPRSFTGPAIVRRACSACHDSMPFRPSVALLPTKESSSKKSFHGVFSDQDGRRVANCASCHGTHEVTAPDAPGSALNSSNLGRACSSCHQDPGEVFSILNVHGQAPRVWSGLREHASNVDSWLIAFVLLACAIYALMFLRVVLLRKRLAPH